MLRAPGGGDRRARRGRRELVHVRDVGVAPGGTHDPRRGPDRVRSGLACARGRELLHPVESLGRLLLRRGLLDPRHPPRAPDGRSCTRRSTPFELPSDAVARGNRKVFEEIGCEFARYLHECPADAPDDAAELEAFLAGLRAGDPPEGQRYLRQAFMRYARAHAGRRAGARRAVPAGEPRDRAARADAPAARDPRFARRAVRRRAGHRPAPAARCCAGNAARRAVPRAAAARSARWARAPARRRRHSLARSSRSRSWSCRCPGRVLALGAHLRRPVSPGAARDRRRRACCAARALRAASRRRRTTAARATGRSSISACTTSSTCSARCTSTRICSTRRSRRPRWRPSWPGVIPDGEL